MSWKRNPLPFDGNKLVLFLCDLDEFLGTDRGISLGKREENEGNM